MKTILIQAVSNGWIVTERFACRDIASEPVAVFNNIRDLQTALPALLDIVPIGIPLTNPHAAVGYIAPTSMTAWPPQK